MFARFAFQACSFNRHWHQDQAVQNGQFDEERSGSGDRCTTDALQQPHDISHSGSIYGVGWRFQSFRINDLEMVAQICPRWNRLQPWFELVGAFKDAA